MYISLILRKQWAMPRTKASAKAKLAWEAAARSRERASREATPDFEEDDVHSNFTLSSFLDAQSKKICFVNMGGSEGRSRPGKPICSCTSSYPSTAVCIELSNSKKMPC
jgi:hypothetical protein